MKTPTSLRSAVMTSGTGDTARPGEKWSSSALFSAFSSLLFSAFSTGSFQCHPPMPPFAFAFAAALGVGSAAAALGVGSAAAAQGVGSAAAALLDQSLLGSKNV